MVDESSPSSSSGQHVFVSYSRADRQRVVGVATLLEALGHRVFMDERSILAGERWKARLMDEVRRSDVLVVFWTRNAARSVWVAEEYETFAREYPARPLLPILGDSTPLSPALKERQATNFLPLLNELLVMMREMEARGLSKSQVRKAVVERLAQEGIRLPSGKLNRVFGMCGIVGLATFPLHALLRTRDLILENLAELPRGYVYTVIGTSAVSFVVCGSITHEDTQDLLATVPRIKKVDIGPNSTGTQACEDEDKGLICVSVDRARVEDKNGRFFGYSTPTCEARVVRSYRCRDDYGTDYEMTGVVVRRSPNADPEVLSLDSLDFFCLGTPKGRQGLYGSANCAIPD